MNITGRIAAKMLFRGIRNRIEQRPLSVSFEITHACTANCWHCNWGGPVKGEKRLGAEDYARICRDLRPVVAHISGGEPLARSDVYDIVRAMARPGDLPWMVMVSNASNLTVERYRRLRQAGINQFSISLDFPDDRHSEFRRIPGLFQKMDRVIPRLAALGNNDVSLNACITAWNFREVPEMVRLAKRWGTPINFSAYTPLRLSDLRGMPAEETYAELRRVFETVIAMKRAGYPVYTSERVLWKFYRFLTGGTIPGCQAGRRFLVINPDGRLTPCAMVMAYHTSQRTMLREFTRHNTCEMCYISTRANTEKTPFEFVADNLQLLLERIFRRRSRLPDTTLPWAEEAEADAVAEELASAD
ncbi:MAG: radical SAM protein [Gemmatimonadetes bacterium]|nr:radical SAM protein [Gemmatimonadota bacterium]